MRKRASGRTLLALGLPPGPPLYLYFTVGGKKKLFAGAVLFRVSMSAVGAVACVLLIVGGLQLQGGRAGSRDGQLQGE